MHPRNRYQQPHDFLALAKIVPELSQHFSQTPTGKVSLDFTHPAAVRALNQALLFRDYGLKHWRLPAGNLCPGVPGRLDYIHVVADLLQEQPPTPQTGTSKIHGLDIGTGASLIYPILACKEYGWRMVGTDVDPTSLKVATAIARFNPGLADNIIVRRQPAPNSLFHQVIFPGEYFDFTMCNPPFFASPKAAADAAAQKWKKLGKTAQEDVSFNFGGQANELWTKGGEPEFLRRMIRESVAYGQQVGWFTTLVSKKGYLNVAKVAFGKAGITHSKVVGIGQGGKIRRVLCWQIKD